MCCGEQKQRKRVCGSPARSSIIAAVSRDFPIPASPESSTTWLQHRPGPHRPGNALELPNPKVLELEEAAEKPSRAFGDDDHVRLGKALQARRKIWRLADHAALLRLTR